MELKQVVCGTQTTAKVGEQVVWGTQTTAREGEIVVCGTQTTAEGSGVFLIILGVF